jgi:hypothetical protein
MEALGHSNRAGQVHRGDIGAFPLHITSARAIVATISGALALNITDFLINRKPTAPFTQ